MIPKAENVVSTSEDPTEFVQPLQTNISDPERVASVLQLLESFPIENQKDLVRIFERSTHAEIRGALLILQMKQGISVRGCDSCNCDTETNK